jgi:hypothetical protein
MIIVFHQVLIVLILINDDLIIGKIEHQGLGEKRYAK